MRALTERYDMSEKWNSHASSSHILHVRVHQSGTLFVGITQEHEGDPIKRRVLIMGVAQKTSMEESKSIVLPTVVSVVSVEDS